MANYSEAKCLPQLTSELGWLSENRRFLYKVFNFHFPYEIEYKFPYEEKDKIWKNSKLTPEKSSIALSKMNVKILYVGGEKR